MAIIGGQLGYRILCTIAGGETDKLSGSAYAHNNKLEVLMGKNFWNEVRGKVVIDFGCGKGSDAIEMAKRGARRVIGVDIQDRCLQAARRKAEEHGVSDRCEFTSRPEELADVIVTIDTFEHFDDPPETLRIMRRLLRENGSVIASFGPTWYHPYGGHLFSVFPWSHLLFSEDAQIRWRSTFKSDGATRFHEVAGGLNQMTIRRFKRMVRESPFELTAFEPVPIRKLKWLANPLTQEFTTAIIRCRLVPSSAGGAPENSVV